MASGLEGVPNGEWYTRAELGLRSSDRYQSYHRLDLRISREKALRSGRLRIFFEVINLLDRDNRRSTSDHALLATSPGSPIATETEYEDWFPLVPSLGIAWEL